MTTALSTSRPKLEIDGRPISRLLSGLTPSAHPVSLFLAHPYTPSFPLEDLQLDFRWEDQAVWGGGTHQPGLLLAPSLRLTQTEVPTCWDPHQTGGGQLRPSGQLRQREGEDHLKLRPAVIKEDKRQITGGRQKVSTWKGSGRYISLRAAGLHHRQNQFSFQFFRSLIYQVFQNIILFTEASDSI